MKDYTLIATAYNKEARIYAATSTNLVQEAHEIHKTWPTASAALGRFLTASAMMSLMYKDDEHLTLKIEGEGPLKYLLAEAHNGIVRGDIGNPEVYLKYHSGPKAGKLNVGMAVGAGLLTVTKDLNMRQPFTSSTPLVSGEIGDDFTYYFTTSEQTPSAVGVGVLVNVDNSILVSGGFIVQLLPSASEQTISSLEKALTKISSVTDLMQEGKKPEDLIHILASGTEEILDKREIKYHCPCSKEGFASSLSYLDNKTLEELIHEDHGAEINCHFCGKKYHFSENDLKDIINNK
ncbi:33 kDa chaperonin (Heat shock protein 33 homolog) [Alteracholeplasma palmae J233]|uniref:33 kDa chaperonin n=1 Tax=Alteracholeplasma palmae (strain ATCC 49389 / J233) TaxID=1318466 RepID=U4KQQ1_ALTPJ|nr:Hsp33 family molecular chaperone HslO [Alteracholeplasma palmae]CCV64970.1 33 kDa chaperonin (Heat shock protein 33 homolog) [Alteracholeplasma palmae J233]